MPNFHSDAFTNPTLSTNTAHQIQHIYVPYRCYLLQNGKHAGTRALGMTLEDVSGITQFHTIDSDGTEQIYDLNGRQLSAPAKGINIINGKKVFMNE